MIRGAQSIAFECPAYLVSSASVSGNEKKEKAPLGKDVLTLVAKEDLFGENTWEEAESAMQKEACQLALRKAHLKPEEVRILVWRRLAAPGSGDFQGVEALKIPMFGLYGACSTSGEALALAGMSVAAGYGDYMLAVTSSHFASAEKEFRFPLGYASQRPLSAHWTVTGSGAFVVGKRKSGVDNRDNDWENCGLRIKGFPEHGSCMAPAACDTILQNLKDLSVRQRITTGLLREIWGM